RETAWYAIGLLRRDGPEDRRRAEAALGAVVAHQYDEPGTPWHGTFVRFPEWPAPRRGAVEWVDYDPNWRQFLGSALAIAVTDFDLPTALRVRAVDAVQLAVAAEPPDRVPPTYANIALLRAWLAAWSGHPDVEYAAAVVDAFRRHGCFTEYGSPTYYGIDLLALALWQRRDAPDQLRRDGRSLAAALWSDIARWWHAGLGNLCGPYSRAYGMDLASYVSGLSLALWCAGLPAPLPPLDADEVPHGHDVCMAPVLEHVGVAVPPEVRSAFERFSGPRAVHQVIDDAPRREATGWLEELLMVGAEDGATRLQARGQFHPATVHWRRAGGGVGWLRVEHRGPTRARASERRLVVECHGDGPVTWVTASPVTVEGAVWHLDGLTAVVTTDARPDPGAPLSFAGSPAGSEGGVRFELVVAPDR
ncbi:MAG TPA: hypothetical protein VFI44_04940, partial [Ornithinibacter sp.]|nr:hypothetical protein [Ornithinibacter sp.]